MFQKLGGENPGKTNELLEAIGNGTGQSKF